MSARIERPPPLSPHQPAWLVVDPLGPPVLGTGGALDPGNFFWPTASSRKPIRSASQPEHLFPAGWQAQSCISSWCGPLLVVPFMSPTGLAADDPHMP